MSECILVQLLSPVWLGKVTKLLWALLTFLLLKRAVIISRAKLLALHIHCLPFPPGLAARLHPPASLISRHLLVTKLLSIECTEMCACSSLVQLHPHSAFHWLTTTWWSVAFSMYRRTNQVQDMEKQEGRNLVPEGLFSVLPNELKCFLWVKSKHCSWMCSFKCSLTSQA